MRKLMSANLARLWKTRVFWLGMLVMAVYSVISMLSNSVRAIHELSALGYSLDEYYFSGMPAIGAFIAVFTSLFLGTEYSDGTIRNKLMVGHTRTAVYFTSLATTFLAALLMLLVWYTGGLVGIPLIGAWQMDAAQLLTYFAISILMVAATCSIMTLVCMLSTNKALTAVLCLLLWIGMALCGRMFDQALCEPEFFHGASMMYIDGQVVPGSSMPNDNYIRGTKRMVYEFMADFLPVGQGIQMAAFAVMNPFRMMLSSMFIIIATTPCGMFFFKRKSLK